MSFWSPVLRLGIDPQIEMEMFGRETGTKALAEGLGRNSPLKVVHQLG